MARRRFEITLVGSVTPDVLDPREKALEMIGADTLPREGDLKLFRGDMGVDFRWSDEDGEPSVSEELAATSPGEMTRLINLLRLHAGGGGSLIAPDLHKVADILEAS